MVKVGPARYRPFSSKGLERLLGLSKDKGTPDSPVIRYLSRHIRMEKISWRLEYSLPDPAILALSCGAAGVLFDLAAAWLQRRIGGRPVVSYTLKPVFGENYSLSGDFSCMLRLRLGHIVVSLGIFIVQQILRLCKEGMSHGTASY
jgi:hypothetical protein